MTPAPGSPAYRHIAASLAEAIERQHNRLAPLSNDDEPKVRTRCARNFRGPDDALHICTGGKFCKGKCKPTRGTLAEHKSRKQIQRA